MDNQENHLAAIPSGLESEFQKTISQRIFPHDLFPRHWFPDLDAILSGLFREIWKNDRDFRNGLAAADQTQAAEMIEAELSLNSILARHPRAVIMIYRQLITGFIQRLHPRPNERQDILQEIFTRLLSGKLAKIQNKFDANFKQTTRFTSYFMVCVRNMYVDIVREGRNLPMKRADVPLQILEMEPHSRTRTCQTTLLEEEFDKLRVILQLLPTSRDKIRLCLKLKCRSAVTAAAARRCFPACSPDDILQLGADFRNTKDRELYKAIAPVFNRYEAKPVLADTLRKWVESKTSLLIAHLNRLHNQNVYDGKNITDLLGLFFGEEDDCDET